MRLRVLEGRNALGSAAAAQAAAAIERAIRQKGKARIIGASAASQFEFLEALTRTAGIDWKAVELFHLDEYIGLPKTHPASFCKFLQDRLISKTGIVTYHFLDGEKDPSEVIRRTTTDSRVDMFALGVTAFEVFTYTLPWEKAQSLQTLLSHMNSPGRDPAELVPGIDKATRAFLLKAVERDRDSRFQTPAEFRDALKRLPKQDW